jgi:arylsulfatase A-like enzyme
MNRTSITLLPFVIIAVMSLFTSCNSPDPGGDRQPNIILIMADDLSPRWFSIYGEQDEVSTPNIDRLGAEGVCFRTSWATPMCTPSRGLIMTGQYGMRTGWLHNSLVIPDHEGNRDFLKRGTKTFAAVLKEAGYTTAICSRWGIPASWELGSRDFDEHCMHIYYERNLPEGVKIKEMKMISPADESVHEDQYQVILSLETGKYNGYQEADFQLESEIGYGSGPLFSRYWHPAIVHNGKLLVTEPFDFATDLYMDFTVDFLDRNRKRPSLVYLPLHIPHNTSIPTERGVAREPTTPASGRPGTNYGGNMKEVTTYLDMAIGNLLTGLESKDLLRNTIIIFTADNADSEGPTAIRPGKTVASDNGARVPFIVWGPGLVKQRGLTDELCELSDVFPTLAGFAGAALPEGQLCDGKSLKPFLYGKSDSHREWIFSYIGTARMLRDKRYLIEAADPEFGTAQGRFYDCGDNRSGFGYREITDPSGEDMLAAERMYALLDSLPEVDFSQGQAKDALEYYRTEGRFHHKLKNWRSY